MKAMVWTVLVFMVFFTVAGIGLIIKGQPLGLLLEILAGLVGWAGLRWAKQLRGER